MIKAITFDLWDTLVIDDSDEMIRAKAGLPTKKQARLEQYVGAVCRRRPDISRERAVASYQKMNQWFNEQWNGSNHTPHIQKRLAYGLKDFELQDDPLRLQLSELFASMEVEYPPKPAPGVHECLGALKDKYRLGIVSDSIITPGSHLRKVLQKNELLHYFDILIFSDEVGASKPSPTPFASACRALGGIEAHTLLHIGDREERDIAGAMNFGAKALLYTGVQARLSSAESQTALHAADLRDIPPLVAQLSIK